MSDKISLRERSRSHSRKRRNRSRSRNKEKKHKSKKRDKHGSAAPPMHFQTGIGPPPMWRPFGYPMPGWAPPHVAMPPPYGMHVPPMGPHSTMADDGVSMQVSGKFLMRNDYCQTFLDTGLRPQNHIRDLDYQNRYSEYPKIERLISLKDDILKKRATPAMSLKADLKNFDLLSLGIKFDVILLDPPWEEYHQRVSGIDVIGEDLDPWSLDEIKELKIDEIADTQSFCFLWCGQTHLEQGRELFKRWGFRRIEDIVWVKTNRQAAVDEKGHVKQANVMYGDTSILQRTKEHCLMGIKGTLKRSIDTHFLHANCDTDLIMCEEESFGSTHKPRELYETVEHFCLGRRRLELFGLDRNMRDGWLTLGKGLTFANWNKELYHSWFEGDKDVCYPRIQNHVGGRLLGSIAEIDALRPKSPERQGRTKDKVEEDRPLPEDLGEMAPPPETGDGGLPPNMRPQSGDMKYK